MKLMLFAQNDQFKWVMPVFVHVYLIEMSCIWYTVNNSIYIRAFQVISIIRENFLFVQYLLPKTKNQMYSKSLFAFNF